MRTETQRPYASSSIGQLEELFVSRPPGRETLEELLNELAHRKTSRAGQLIRKVQESLRDQAATSSKADGSSSTPVGHTPATERDKALTTPEDGRKRTDEDATPRSERTKPVALPIEPFPTPKNRNEPGSIIAAWIALEALSPETYSAPHDLANGDRSRVVRFEGGSLPWASEARSRPGYQLYYRAVLGSIRMDPATEALVKVFGDDEARTRMAKKYAVAAEIILDRKGIPLPEESVSVSSFAWALPLALSRRFGELGGWPNVEQALQTGIDAIVQRVDSEGQPLPLDLPTLEKAYLWLVEQCAIPEEMIERPAFVLRHFHPYKAKTQPDPMLLNSFFLHDLARTANHLQSKSAPKGIQQYLGATEKPVSVDLLKDHSMLEEAVSPRLVPEAKWPKEGQSLVILQQAAVNLARRELRGEQGLLAVNGPPGTGKTTLLRDVVAMCILDRATAMSSFEEPDKAFTKTGERVSAGNAFFDIYTLDPTLKGYEMLVTSSNNKAVENISKELPGQDAVNHPAGLNYFKSISDVVHGPRRREDEDEGITPEPVDTWGLIAAVLGNKGNRSAFWKALWWDEDRGLRTYLKAAKGDSVMIEVTNPDSGVVERRTPSVVLSERPPSPQLAKSNWINVRAQFLEFKKEIETEFQELESVRQLCLELVEPRRQLERKESEIAGLAAELLELTAKVLSAGSDREQATSVHQRALEAWLEHKKSRPGLFARIRRTDEAKAWKKEDEVWHRPVRAAAELLWTAEETLKAMDGLRSLTGAKHAVMEATLEYDRVQISEQLKVIDAHRKRLQGRLVDDDKFGETHESWNMSIPWVTPALNRRREQLFVSALAVHRAFIDSAAAKIFHNLGALQATGSTLQKSEERRTLLGDLWSTLFMIVPVLSTTFASVERMLGELPPATLGWLLIDEAGQASPQAAVGAMLRAKRSVVVGDPLQIPPVVTLPERLNAGICDFFKLDQCDWAAPDASTQTLTDRASRYQSSFKTDAGERRVGLPLLVHRRCQEPMFTISNRIAYANQMVLASGSKKDDVEVILGRSTWFDIDGVAESKWCKAEGSFVMELLEKLSTMEPGGEVFIISPFRIVSDEMSRLVEGAPAVLRRFTSDGSKWIKDHVGTVHTFQGREADTVILLLGAPAKNQQGAREWAAGTPNILNVAASRAKHNLYVVGSYSAWSGVGLMPHMANRMPKRTAG